MKAWNVKSSLLQTVMLTYEDLVRFPDPAHDSIQPPANAHSRRDCWWLEQLSSWVGNVARWVKLSLVFHFRMPIRVLAILLPIQFLANVPGRQQIMTLQYLSPCQPRGRAGWSSWLLPGPAVFESVWRVNQWRKVLILIFSFFSFSVSLLNTCTGLDLTSIHLTLIQMSNCHLCDICAWAIDVYRPCSSPTLEAVLFSPEKPQTII